MGCAGSKNVEYSSEPVRHHAVKEKKSKKDKKEKKKKFKKKRHSSAYGDSHSSFCSNSFSDEEPYRPIVVHTTEVTTITQTVVVN